MLEAMGNLVSKQLIIGLLNYAMLAGSIAVKAPQIVNIWARRSVEGISEMSFVVEMLGTACLVLYNVLKGYPFPAWGEMFFVCVQCKIQCLSYWYFAKPRPNMTPRAIGSVIYIFIMWALYQFLPAEYWYILGTLPTFSSMFSRAPQIMMNFKQKHTGNLSIITIGLSWAGNCVRILTTLSQTPDDMIMMGGHFVAFALNFIILAQMGLMWSNTKAVLKKVSEEKEMKEPAEGKKQK